MQTRIVQYDKFVAIQELGVKLVGIEKDKLNEYFYVAIGKSPIGDLSDGSIQLVDIRQVDNTTLVDKTITAFDSMCAKQTPQYVRDIEGEWDTSIVIGQILDTWILADELNNATIH